VAEPVPPPFLLVTVRYFGAARSAAGVVEETVPVPASTVAEKNDRMGTVGTVVAVIADRHGAELSRVLPRCSYLLDEVAVHGPSTRVRAGQVLDVLPPFAGG
jgi:molybdopterin converting factor small subunit